MKAMDFSGELRKRSEMREPFVVATVVEIEGSSIGKPGFKAILSKDCHIVYGTLGGVCPESAISSFVLNVLETGKARTVKVFLENAPTAVAGTVGSASEDEVHVETNCGGMMRIYIEPYLPAERLIILAKGGRDGIEDALVKLGKLLDFEVVVIDHIPVFEEAPDTLITDQDYDLTKYAFTHSDSVVILTHSAQDVPILTLLSTKNVRYVGLIASRDRARGELAFMMKKGVSKEFAESVKSPVGADIGAQTSQEIAISIMAEVIAMKHGKHLPRKSLMLEAPPGEVAQPIGRS